jgi:sortase A
MRLVVTGSHLKRILRWTQRVLVAVAAVTLTYSGLVVADSWIFQRRERRQLDRMLMVSPANRAAALTASPEDGLIGQIEILRLGLSVMVIEGTSRTTLRRAAGHIPGTALPGQAGNVAISAHRDTFFRPLRNVRRDDIITLTTLHGKYRYRVVSTRIVSPADVAVLDAGANEILTLITCYPFYFVGSAPDRFVVRAERVIS